ncbi:SURF1 family protein [Undibacterium sp. WLX3042]|uniref:SURF1 family protein n=1 Tax=Undibacterium sp. WLX3042 TaxID=3412686 RepID=UPI003C2C8898
MSDLNTGAQPPVVATDSPRSLFARRVLAICAGVVFLCFAFLGTWQIYRLQWKIDLIARVEQRVHAPANAAPDQRFWPGVNVANDEYRHVQVSGQLLSEQTSYVQASTVLGSGYWMLTPLRQSDGSIVLINRGFVPAQNKTTSAAQPQLQTKQEVSVTGLLRMPEPGGGFLRKNDAAADRWYSRDVAAIAKKHSLSPVAPYFIDADAADSQPDAGYKSLLSNEAQAPVGGLTVISFHNNHLVYALTWYALALMVAGGYYLLVREDRRRLSRTQHHSENGRHQDVRQD